MAKMLVSHNPSQNPAPQENGFSRDDITVFQGQLPISERPPKSLLDWLVRVHLRLMALEEEYKDTG